jgi:hypothetical protein
MIQRSATASTARERTFTSGLTSNRVLLRAAAALALVLATAACASSSYVWYRAAQRYVLEAALPRVEEATRATLSELDLVGVDAQVDKLQGEVTARMADGTKVSIWLKAVDFERTTVDIRVGRLGDSVIAEQIIRHIQRRL